MTSGREIVHVDLADHVLTVTMDRPEARNALSRRMIGQLMDAFSRLDGEGDCWVGVLQAEGPSFCAGADLKDLARNSAATPRRSSVAPTSRSLLHRRRKPLIACVEGHAFGGGLEIILASCDIVVASTSAQFALTEVQRGLVASGGGMFRLPRRLPESLAMEMVLTGRPQAASTMYQHGFVNRLVAPGETRAAARELALQIVENSPVAVQAALEVARTSSAEGWSDEESWDRQRPAIDRVMASEDVIEGVRAFNERRPARWQGR